MIKLSLCNHLLLFANGLWPVTPAVKSFKVPDLVWEEVSDYTMQSHCGGLDTTLGPSIAKPDAS